MTKYFEKIVTNKYNLILVIIFLFEIFFRFYQLDYKNPFGYDQVDNAWAAKKIIIDHNLPLVGMVAKSNSGIYIGPLYYYLISIFYFFTNLDPIASSIFAGLTSIFTFLTLYFVVKKLFNNRVALIAIFINTFFIAGITFDRVQWPVNFIPGISLLIFYCLFEFLKGKHKYLVPLFILMGLAFNIHLTAIFFPLIIMFTLPFFPRDKATVKYFLLSIPFFVIWLVPNILYLIQQHNSAPLVSYSSSNFHGFHLRRVIQLFSDALIQYNKYLPWDKIVFLKYIILPVFIFHYLFISKNKFKLIFIYLILLWFIVPWSLVGTRYGVRGTQQRVICIFL
jgi:4-amino-4-deoxy-L-arabinose transferase-like glycosyltransferase